MQYRVTVNGKVYDVTVELVGQAAQAAPAVAVAPVSIPVAVPAPVLHAPAPVAPVAATGDENIVSPFPGNIIDVLVKVGQSVKAGQCLVMLEAMKMENEIVATRDGVVKQTLVSKGTNVNTDDVLVVIG